MCHAAEQVTDFSMDEYQKHVLIPVLFLGKNAIDASLVIIFGIAFVKMYTQAEAVA